jgi:hypothetical protein
MTKDYKRLFSSFLYKNTKKQDVIIKLSNFLELIIELTN